MKTAVSIPEDVFRRAERLARRQKRSRSGLYAEALREYISRHEDDAITAALDRVCPTIADDETAAFRREAARRQVRKSPW